MENETKTNHIIGEYKTKNLARSVDETALVI